MYYISEKEWRELERRHSDYAGRSVQDPDTRVIMEGLIPGNNGKGGTTLLFEHKHFEVVDTTRFPDRATVAKVRAEYPAGTRVVLTLMDDPQAPPVGTEGIVRGVDDIGSIMVDWANGSTLHVVLGADRVSKID